MPTDIITYRYDGKLVYVPVAPTYIQALSHARDAFPQLKGLCDASLSLSITTPTHGHVNANAPTFIDISASAWPKLTTHMSRYQIIDVRAHGGLILPIPNIIITDADGEDVGMDSDPAPPYRTSGDEKASYSAPPRPSSAPAMPKRSWFLHRLHSQ